MTTKTYTTRVSHAFSVLAFAAACGLTACAPEDEGDPYVAPADGGFTTTDAAVVATGDAGTVVATRADTGVAAPFDAGITNPIPTTDSGAVSNDAGPVVTSDAGTPDGGGTTRPDQGMGDGKDVITIGDSWMNLNPTSGIEISLEKVSMRNYRNFGISGTRLLSGTNKIPDQYAKAKAEDKNIKTVVMTGGGNDILQEKLDVCVDAAFDSSDACSKQIDAVAAGLVALWAQMATDGVQDVLLVSYSDKTNPFGLIGTTKKSIAYSDKKISPLCAVVPAPLRCTILNADMAVPSLGLMIDGIHPDNPSYDKIGTAVWELMKSSGMRR